MKQREIKFRAWDGKKMHYPDGPKYVIRFDGVAGQFNPHSQDYSTVEWVVMQFCGLHDKNGKEVYEGDIFRIEENDEESTVIIVVVVWIQEWTMFASLTVDEYKMYLIEGSEALDESMFWTYTLEDINSPKHYPCGNIYQNPELLK